MWYYALEIPQHSNYNLIITFRLPLRFQGLGIFDVGEVGHINRYVYGRYEGDRFQKWVDSANSKLSMMHSLNWVQDENTFTIDATGVKNLAILVSTDESYGFDDPEATGQTTRQGAEVIQQGPIKQNAALDSLPGPIESIRIVWVDEVLETKTVAKERQVPYEVEKQRTVTQIKKVPFWEAVFSE